MSDTIAPQALGLPPVPESDLDAYLDAAARCFIRHGIGRTRVTDIADDVGVSRVTVYRKVGTTDQAARLLLARELDRLLTRLAPKVAAASTAEDVVDVIAEAIDYALEHPVLKKVRADESDLVGSFAATELPALIDRLIALGDPLLRRVVSISAIVDPGLLADWLARIVLSIVIAPPTVPVKEFLGSVLVPILSLGASPPTEPGR